LGADFSPFYEDMFRSDLCADHVMVGGVPSPDGRHADTILAAMAAWAFRPAAAAYGSGGQQKAQFSRIKLYFHQSNP